MLDTKLAKQIEKQEGDGALKRAANLAANLMRLMRLVRGAGKPFHKRPVDESVALRLPKFEPPSLNLPGPDLRVSRSEAALTAALEVAASSLIGQERQHDNALNDLQGLLDRLLRDKERAQRRAAKSKSQKPGR